jgi:ketosteroid isomerase-like protein
MRSWAFAAACLLCLGGLPCGATEPTSVASTDESEVDRAIGEYTEAFIKGDLEAIVAHCATPFVVVSPKGMTVLATTAEIEARYVATLRDLRQRGYAYSKRRETHIKLLDQNLALASAVFIRYRDDGSELETGGNTYLLRKDDGRWRIVENISHPPDRVIR